MMQRPSLNKRPQAPAAPKSIGELEPDMRSLSPSLTRSDDSTSRVVRASGRERRRFWTKSAVLSTCGTRTTRPGSRPKTSWPAKSSSPCRRGAREHALDPVAHPPRRRGRTSSGGWASCARLGVLGVEIEGAMTAALAIPARRGTGVEGETATSRLASVPSQSWTAHSDMVSGWRLAGGSAGPRLPMGSLAERGRGGRRHVGGRR